MLAVALLLSTSPAAANPLTDKRARAQQVRRELAAFDAKLEPAIEDYNLATAQYRTLTRKVESNRARLATLAARIDVLQASLGVRADSMYRTGSLGVVDVLLGTATFSDFATTWDLLNQMNAQEAQSVRELVGARQEALQVGAELAQAQAQAQSQQKAVGDRKNRIESEIAKRKQMIKGLESEIAALEAEEARRATAELAKWRATRPSGGGSSAGGWDWGNPTREPRSGVVDIAMRYLGRPYVWAASGPNSFDCSGFTMFVYAQVGVSLPHHSGSQISCGERVSRANLLPGDLVFFGSPIHHVGMYVGGGMMIHAPGTGDHVKISPLHSNYAGACRP